MKVYETTQELDSEWVSDRAFVPTMGALHEGHLSLIRAAKESSSQVVVSIFVNPLQFGPNEDFAKYPRNLNEDAQLAESAGADIIFAPAVELMYPNLPSTMISVPEVTNLWEGARRPGHFDGVATVVAKLFNLVRPKIAYFGRKDLQQCVVVRRMASDLNMNLEIRLQPTVREVDGLAMSSRNRYLSPEERQRAPIIYTVLQKTRDAMLAGTSPEGALREGEEILKGSKIQLEYLAYVDNNSLSPLSRLQFESSLIFAGKLGSTRLIDNISVE